MWKWNKRLLVSMGQLVLLVAVGLIPPAAQAEATWTLENSVRRAVQRAPELGMAEAEIGMRKGDVQSADAWPNPSLEIRADEKLGLSDGSGGVDITQLVVSQQIPLKRLGYQRQQAQALLSASHQQRQYQQLVLEHEVATAFHSLQLHEALWRLSSERLGFAEQYQNARAKDPLVRYLSPLERKRMAIMREEARQAVASAEGDYAESRARFSALLGIDPEASIALTALSTYPLSQSLQDLQDSLNAHPALVSGQHQLDAAQSGVASARASRLADPSISLFIERDNFAGGTENFAAIAVNVQIPLWNRGQGQVDRASAELYRQQSKNVLERRDLESRLRQSYVHVRHLIEQAGDHREHLLKPTQEVFAMTRKGFAAGEQNLLELIDANKTFFDARARYLQLQASIGLELALLRLTAGLSLIDSDTQTVGGAL